MYPSRERSPRDIMAGGDMTRREIQRVARIVIGTLGSLGLRSVIFCGAACSALGSPRFTADVDVVALTSDYKQEEVKCKIAASDPRFVLVPSKNAHATYNVLWYKLDRLPVGRKCKVDISVPGLLNIPDIPQTRIVTIVKGDGKWEGLPLMPFIPLLMLKLQGWDNRRRPTEAKDIKFLLGLAIQRVYKLDEEATSWLPAEFVQAAQKRALVYNAAYPGMVALWRMVGFKV